MAVDTAEKRLSMMNFGDGNNWHTLPQSDSTIDLDDRQHLLDCYSGVVFAGGFISAPKFEGLRRHVGRLMH